jgi:formyltetrahydrofolate-dependent phosphoribosylglycinamide formyltransferase
MRVAVCASGGGSNLGALLEALRGSPLAQVSVVLSNRADAGALDRARAAGTAAEVFTDFRDGAEWLRRLEAHGAELIVLAGYLKLVPAAVIEAFRGRIINIHPALLPKFGGAGMYGQRVHQAVLAAGETQSGATVHLVDEVYDRGAILAQAIVPVRPDDDADRLAARVLQAEHRLLPAVVLRAAAVGHPVPLPEPLTFPA